MYKILTLFLFTFGLLSAKAQSDHYNRCEIDRIEDINKFEHWLTLKHSASSGKLPNTIYKIPVVVHVLFHSGEQIGEGFNFSTERIKQQIKTLNEDFRRKEGTPGFNIHPDGGDARIEFILAQVDPNGNSTDGIVRIDVSSVHLPPIPPDSAGDAISAFARYSYWNPDQYLNIWCVDVGLPPGTLLGSARFPITDLEGIPAENIKGDGVFINALNFGSGEINNDLNYNMGRTLTHEIGHFLGLLHIWGACSQYSDYCEDTPPVNSPTNGCPSARPIACDGRQAMTENYMDYSYDVCMNIFTNDQIARMHTVLENSPRRKSLTTSAVIAGIPNDITEVIHVFPNPATGRLYVSSDEKMLGNTFQLTAYNFLGQSLFKKSFEPTTAITEIPISEVKEKMIILTIEGSGLFYKKLIIIN